MRKVSIIIATYNCANYISAAIDSVIYQTCQDFEIIIIDDGSTDNTRQIIDKYIEIHDNIKYLYQNNKGLAVARNLGFTLVEAEYIAFLDADDMWFPDRLEVGVNILDNDLNVGLVHANDVMINEEGEFIIRKEKRNTKLLSGNIAKNLLFRKIHIRGGTVLFRTTCLDKVGVLDENLTRLGVEDRDLWYRISLNYNVQFVDKTIAYYRIRQNSLSKDYHKMMEGRLYLIDKYYPPSKLNKSIRKKLLSSLFYHVAKGELWNNKFEDAAANFIIALKYKPFKISSYLYLVKMFIKKFYISIINLMVLKLIN